MSLRPCIRRLVIAALLAAPSISFAQAQEVQRIAAVVNDEAVSVFDVVERVKLVVASSGLDSSPNVMQRIAPQVLRSLIDERLRLQEAKRENISVTDDEIALAISIIERRNQMPAHSFEKFLDSRHINRTTFETQIRAEIAWSKLVDRRLRDSVTISDEDVDEELERLRRNQGKPEYLISEIFLIVDRADQDKRVRNNAVQLVEQIRAGGNFVALARQFSEGVTAAQGGNVGWVTTDQLADPVAAAVTSLRPGQVSDPIAAPGGYMIVQLRDSRQLMGADPDDTRVDLKQILFALPANATADEVASQLALARTTRAAVSGCDDMARVAAEIDPSTSGDLGMVRLKDLPPNLRTTVRNLPIATVSEPVRTGRGVHLLMVCDRIEPESTLPGREEIRQSLLESRLDQVARHYLRDLRRSAFVDIRI